MGSRIKELATSDTGFVFDPSTGATFTVNATGLRVLRALKDGLPPDRISQLLSANFDVRSGDPARDTEDFIALLAQHGLASGDGGAP